jgi:hypothetical protein
MLPDKKFSCEKFYYLIAESAFSRRAVIDQKAEALCFPIAYWGFYP